MKNFSDDVELQEASVMFCGYANLYNHSWKEYGCLTTVKNWTTQWHSNHSTRYLPQGQKNTGS